MAYVNTTFLPKTNGMVFGDRLVARADKGRVFGLDAVPPSDPLEVADGQGANWVGTNVYEIGQTVEARTAAYTGQLITDKKLMSSTDELVKDVKNLNFDTPFKARETAKPGKTKFI